MAHNDKKFCLFYFVSQEPYIILLSFMLYMCKMKSVCTFFIFFKTLIFNVIRGRGGEGRMGKRAKLMAQKQQKILVVPRCILGSIHHVIMIFHVQNDDIPWYFFYSYKIFIFQVARW